MSSNFSMSMYYGCFSHKFKLLLILSSCPLLFFKFIFHCSNKLSAMLDIIFRISIIALAKRLLDIGKQCVALVRIIPLINMFAVIFKSGFIMAF